MSPQHARQFSRRRFLGGMTFAGTVGLLGVHARRVAAEPPPETTRIRLVRVPSICQAPSYVAEELLRNEGFTEVHYLQKEGLKASRKPLPLVKPTSMDTSPLHSFSAWRQGIPSSSWAGSI